MSKYGDKDERYIWPSYDKGGDSSAQKSDKTKTRGKSGSSNGSPNGSDDSNTDKNSDTKNTDGDDTDTDDDDIDTDSDESGPKIWLEVLPSKGGLVLAALLADIMTDGLTADQENILGNFVSSVGSLISYKAARDDI